MKKVISLLLALAMLSAILCLFAGCGGTSGGSGDEILRFWAYQPASREAQASYKALLEKFEAETGITVQVNFIGKDNYKRSFEQALTSSKKPDIAYLDQPLVSDYAADGVLYDMTADLAANPAFARDRFYEGAYNTVLYGGKAYGLPLNITTTVLLYNKSLLGGDNPVLPQTLGDMLSYEVPAGKALFDGVGSGGYAAWYYHAFLENFGGSFLNEAGTAVAFNDEKGLAAAQFMYDLYGKSPATVTGSSNAFGRGNVMFKLGSGSDIKTISVNHPGLDFGAMLIPPAQAGGTSYSNIGGENLVIINSSEKKEAALKLMEFLLREENAKAIADYTGNFPAVKEYAATEDPRMQVVLNQLDTACARPALPGWIEVNDNHLGDALTYILGAGFDRADIQEKLDEAAARANKTLFD